MDWKIVLLERPAVAAILAAIEATVRGDDKSRCLGIRGNSAYCRGGVGQSAPGRAPRRAGFIAGIDPTGTCRPHSFRDVSVGHNGFDWLAILSQPARSPMLAAILTGHYSAVDDRNDDLSPGSGDCKRGHRARFPAL